MTPSTMKRTIPPRTTIRIGWIRLPEILDHVLHLLLVIVGDLAERLGELARLLARVDDGDDFGGEAAGLVEGLAQLGSMHDLGLDAR